MSPHVALKQTESSTGRKRLRLPCTIFGVLLASSVFAGGADVSTDEIYSDSVTLQTEDGDPLDIDGDGNTDLAVASNRSGPGDRSRYYLGNGDGTFGARFLLTPEPSSVIVATDLNGSFIDLVQGRRDLTDIWYLGDGAGGFDGGSAVAAADTTRTLGIAVGDLDGDGDLDLVTANGSAGGTTDDPQVNRFYLNDFVPSGTVAFTGADISPDLDITRSVALADMDGDGDLDVIVGNDHTTPNSGRIYLNQLFESGLPVTFAAGIDFGPPQDLTTQVLVGDLDNDGKPDIVAVNGAQGISTGVNRFFMNTSLPGVFQISVGTDVSADVNKSNGGTLADFDGDGDLDLAVANILAADGSQTSRNRLYLNQFVPTGTVGFAAGLDISTDEHDTHDLAAADLNGDGHIDIVVGNIDTTPGVSGRDRRYLNNGTADPFANVVPVIDAQANVLATNEEMDLTILIDDVDVTDADNLFPGDFTLTVQAGANYTVAGNTITPDAGFAGELSVPVIVNDGTDDSDPFELTVTVNNTINFPPEFTSAPVTDATEAVAYVYSVTTSDADAGDTLSITAPVLPAWLTLTDNGDGTATLEGTPDAGEVGDHDVSLQVADATAIDVQDFTIAVAAAPIGNVAPVFTSTPVTDATDAVAYTYSVTASDANAGDTLVITAATTLPTWLILTDNGNGTATLAGTPGTADVGDHAVSLQVSDGTLEALQAFTITVAAAPIGNVAPVFTSTPVTDATDAVAYTYSVTASDANAGDTLVITAATTLPTWLILTDNGNGTATLAGTPGTADVGDRNVSLQVSDGSLEALQAFTITVTAATSGNTAPAFTSTPVLDATAGTTYTYEVAASDADTGDTLEISGPTLPAWLMLSDNGDGTATLTGTPVAGDVGDHDISLEVSDGTGTAEQAFTITVEAAATPPPPPSGGGGGGGSLGFLTLLALGSIAVRRRQSGTKGESEAGE